MNTSIEFTRVKNDVNGNPRYVCDFTELITDDEYLSMSIIDAYSFVAKRANKIGGKKYRGNDFGGGIVFQSYNLPTLEKQILELVSK